MIYLVKSNLQIVYRFSSQAYDEQIVLPIASKMVKYRYQNNHYWRVEPMKYSLPELPYAYDSLEPYIDKETMAIHHTKHHQGYVNQLNSVLEKHPEIDFPTLEELLLSVDKLPEDIRIAVTNNGGGHYNHSLFFSSLRPNHGNGPNGVLKTAIERDFGSYEMFKTAFSEAAKTRFGSGWAWLVKTENGKLSVLSMANQDPVLKFGKPLLGIDVWEHAYYLKYQNRRPEYIENFFNVIDWDIVLERFRENL